MRLFTRNNMDGVVSAALIMRKESDIEDVVFVHPKDVQDGNVDIQPGDALTNLPFHPNAGLWFDHHVSDGDVLPDGVRGMVKDSPSASHVVHDFYGYPEDSDYSSIHDMLHYTDRMDAAHLTFDEVLNPQGWLLLGYMIDPTTGLNLNLDLYRRIVLSIRDGLDIKDILSLDEIRVAMYNYRAQEENSKVLFAVDSKIMANVIIHDLRDDQTPLIGNRFIVFALFPRCNVSVRIKPHEANTMDVVISVGKSIFKRTLKVHIGQLLAEFGGGGLDGAGSCRVARNQVDKTLEAILEKLMA
jgi:hypothetical protein